MERRIFLLKAEALLPVFLILGLVSGRLGHVQERSGAVETPVYMLRSIVERPTGFAEIYAFRLRPTNRARGAAGAVGLVPPDSPFGIPVTADGHLRYDLEVSVRGLREASIAGPAGAYVVWVTTPELDRIEKLGAIDHSGSARYHVSSMNKFLLLVTLETSADVEERRGPIVLRGVSPSGLMQNMESHELFNNMPHDR
jgi:hypothetical protein